MKLSYQSEHSNVSLQDIVESLKCVEGVTEHLHEREDETQKISILSRRVPAYYRANGVRKTGGLSS